MAPRNATLDVAKGIGIILVVMGHGAFAQEPWVFRAIYAFHMPLFFVLAGVFVHDRAPMGRFAAVRAATLLKPYAVVLGASILASLVFEGGSAWHGALLRLTGVLYATGSSLAPWTPLWFLPHLFLGSLALRSLVPVLADREPWRTPVLAALLILLGTRLLPRFHGPWLDPSGLGWVGLPWSLDLLPLTLGLMLIGQWLSQTIQHVRFSLGPVLLAGTGFILFLRTFGQTLDLSARNLGTVWVVLPQAALGILLVLSLAEGLSRWTWSRRPLATLGAASLVILLLHGWFQGHGHYHLATWVPDPTLRAVLALGLGLLGPTALWLGARRFRWLGMLLLPPASGADRHRDSAGR